MQKAHNCSYEFGTEDGKTFKLIMDCKNCKSGKISLNEKDCLINVAEALSKEINVENVVFSHYVEKEYSGAATVLVKMLFQLKDEIKKFSAHSKSEGEQKTKTCTRCTIAPKNILEYLSDILIKDIQVFWDYIIKTLYEISGGKFQDACFDCIAKTATNLEHIIKRFETIVKFIKFESYGIVSDTQRESSMLEINCITQDMPAIKIGLYRVFDKNKIIKPSFSPFWLMPAMNSDAELVKKYNISGSEISLYSLPDKAEDLYYIMPPEYEIPIEYVKLICLASAELEANIPSEKRILTPEQARKYTAEIGFKIIYETAKREGINIGLTGTEEIEKAKFLAEILAKYTAGMGILEVFLEDSNIQDIYIDAPVSKNKIYLGIGNVGNTKLRSKLKTNVQLSLREAESLLSRFRYEAGKPFSEAFPVLESDLDRYGTRVTAVGKPLSPNGIAFALRRHSSEPWTLLKLIHNKTLSPLCAGIISFLIDGRSAILVTGSRGSGKTSLLSALMLEFPQSTRILTIEDTLELPVEEMQSLGYTVQSLLTNISHDARGLNADDALRVALRLGESAMVIGEVRGSEAKTLYESMRTGTAGSSVLGTIHGNSAKAVYERVVYDLGISPHSFSATDIVLVMGLIRPHGSQKQLRRLIQIAELAKNSNTGDFYDLFSYDINEDAQRATEYMHKSDKLRAIASSWGMSIEDVISNIGARAEIRKFLVDYAENTSRYELLGAKWVLASNNAFWHLIENNAYNKKIACERIVDDWKSWFYKNVDYV